MSDPAHEGNNVALCKEGKEVTTGTAALVSEKEPETASKLEVTEGPTIVCKSATHTGEFNMGGASLVAEKVVITFKECSVTNEPNKHCVVSEPIVTKDIKGTFTGAEATKISFAPETGSEFAKITIKNKSETEACTFKAKEAKVTGTQTCGVTAESNAATHELGCETTGSLLKYGATENAAVFELTELVKLSAGGNWGIFPS